MTMTPPPPSGPAVARVVLVDDHEMVAASVASGEGVFSADVASPGPGDRLTALRAVAAGQATATVAATVAATVNVSQPAVRSPLSQLHAHVELEAVVLAARDGLIDLAGA